MVRTYDTNDKVSISVSLPSSINFKLRTHPITLIILQLFLHIALNHAFTTITSNNNHRYHHRHHYHHYQPILHSTIPKTTTTSLFHRHNADLITFDLDDTLFPIAPVITDANGALVQHLRTLGYRHISQDTITDATKTIRRALEDIDEDITYTELRIRAIQSEMERLSPEKSTYNDNGFHDDITAEEVYAQWEAERHSSAERNLFPDAIPMLRKLRSDHPRAVIGAITNGKGSPFEMEDTLAKWFDFCVSGEDSGVFPLRKPHSGIYEVALGKWRDIVRDTTDGAIDDYSNGFGDGGDGLDGCNWFHIGDDLANDVGASAACGAKAIWVDLLEEYGQTASKRVVSVDPAKQPSWSTASQEDLMERKAMADRARTVVAARIERLEALPEVILEILEGIAGT